MSLPSSSSSPSAQNAQSQSQSQSQTSHPFDAIFYALNAHSDSSDSSFETDTDTDSDSGSGSDAGSDFGSDDIDVRQPVYYQPGTQLQLHHSSMASSPLNLNMPAFKFGPLLKQTSFRDLSHLARKQETCFNSAAYLRTRSVLRPQDHADSPHHSQPGLDSLIAHRLPETLCETVLPVPSGFDKVFASQWIDDHHILIGTKCNRLLLLSTLTTRIVEIPYLSVTTGAAAASSAAHSSNVTAVRSPLYRGDSTRPPHLARQDSGIGSMSSTETSTNAGSARPARPSARTPDSPLACVGIHSIAVNPSKTRMAVGSGKPYEVVVYSLPEMVPVCLMTGHSDLVFSLTFVSDDVLVTASRDTTVGIFSLRSDPSEYLETECGVLPVIRPMGVRQEHTSKVRDIKYNPAAKQLTTLGLDSTVRLWDVNRMHVTSKTNLHFPQETVCLGLDPDRSLISIGSQAHVSLLDTRTLGNRNERITSASRILHSFKSPDEGWGVRSLAHIEHLVTCGGGMGRIGFYDLRALHFLPVGEGRVGYLEARMHDGAGIGSGFGDGNTSGRARTAGAAVRSAIYTLAYSEDKTRLFAGGGPLQLGMRGTYCAVW